MRQKYYRRIEKSLSEACQQSVRLTQDNSILCGAVNQLDTQLKVVPGLIGELNQLRQFSLSAEQEYAKVPTWPVWLSGSIVRCINKASPR